MQLQHKLSCEANFKGLSPHTICFPSLRSSTNASFHLTASCKPINPGYRLRRLGFTWRQEKSRERKERVYKTLKSVILSTSVARSEGTQMARFSPNLTQMLTITLWHVHIFVVYVWSVTAHTAVVQNFQFSSSLHRSTSQQASNMCCRDDGMNDDE